MPIVVVGIDHEVAPLDLVEKVTLSNEDAIRMLASVAQKDDLYEAVVLSTCLRTEIYAVTGQFHDAVDDLAEMLSAATSTSRELLRQYLEVRFDDNAVLYIFEVAAGLRSAVPGETEVLGQVKRALEHAREAGLAGPILSNLFQHAIKAGRQVRTATDIARGPTSFAHIAAELVANELQGPLEERKIVVVGAGEMGEELATAICRHGSPLELAIFSRSAQKAKALASALVGVNAHGHGMRSLPYHLEGADAVMVSVSARSVVIDMAMVEAAVGNTGTLGTGAPGKERLGRLTASSKGASSKIGDARSPSDGMGNLVIVDLGMPKNVDPRVVSIKGVSLFDMDWLVNQAEKTLAGRREEYEKANEIISGEIDLYRKYQRERGAVPTLAALRDKVEALRVEELSKARSRHRRSEDISESDWEEIDRITKRTLAKVLHRPTVVLKENAGTPRGEKMIEAARDLFDL
ncbi:MAG: glutamyl-tRNA reductase [Acidimicrobiales bacterium]